MLDICENGRDRIDLAQTHLGCVGAKPPPDSLNQRSRMKTVSSVASRAATLASWQVFDLPSGQRLRARRRLWRVGARTSD